MNVQIVSIENIVVPNGRFREAKPDRVKSLSESLVKFGQLQPIIVDRDYKLVDGLHRYSAAQMVMWPAVACVFRDEVDELFLKEMELEANIQREEMTWQERERAIAALHGIRQVRDPNWSAMQTMALADLPRRADVSEAVKLTKMMDLFPELGKAKSKFQALSWAQNLAKRVLRTDDVKNKVIDYSDIEGKLWHGDSVERIKEVPDGSFSAIITDPPFGIDYDHRKEGSEGGLTAYRDDEASYERLLTMAPDLYRVLRKDGWLIWFLGISWYERCKEVFREAGFIVDEIPIIWDRSQGRTFTLRPDRYFGRAYDIALHCIKGDPQLVERAKPNIIRVAPVGQSEKELLVERPVELYAELIRRLTVPKEVVADFFVGSGSCLAAAASLGRDYFGIELDEERRAYALKKIKAHTRG